MRVGVSDDHAIIDVQQTHPAKVRTSLCWYSINGRGYVKILLEKFTVSYPRPYPPPFRSGAVFNRAFRLSLHSIFFGVRSIGYEWWCQVEELGLGVNNRKEVKLHA